MAFLITLGELIAIVVGYLLPVPWLLELLVVHASPPYIIRHSLGEDGLAMPPILLPLIILFHTIKYLSMWRARFIEERHSLYYLSVNFEFIYLGICIAYV